MDTTATLHMDSKTVSQNRRNSLFFKLDVVEEYVIKINFYAIESRIKFKADILMIEKWNISKTS